MVVELKKAFKASFHPPEGTTSRTLHLAIGNILEIRYVNLQQYTIHSYIIKCQELRLAIK